MSEGGEGVIFDFLRGGVWIFSGMTPMEAFLLPGINAENIEHFNHLKSSM